MKTSLLVSSLLLVSFIPSFSDASSFERVCREATRGDDYEFCVSALDGIPAEKTANIQELAIKAVGHLMAKHAAHVGTQGLGLGKIIKCAWGLVKVVKDLQEAVEKFQAGDIPGAIEEVVSTKDAIESCIDENTIGTDMVSPEVFASEIKAVDVAGKILNRFIKVN